MLCFFWESRQCQLKETRFFKKWKLVIKYNLEKKDINTVFFCGIVYHWKNSPNPQGLSNVKYFKSECNVSSGNQYNVD